MQRKSWLNANINEENENHHNLPTKHKRNMRMHRQENSSRRRTYKTKKKKKIIRKLYKRNELFNVPRIIVLQYEINAKKNTKLSHNALQDEATMKNKVIVCSTRGKKERKEKQCLI